MKMNRRELLQSMGGACSALALSRFALAQLKNGEFTATKQSLQGYEIPDWFRDAKFGIWACWGPESVPMQGDWYARNLYIQGSSQNKFHVDHYGHPSKFGFKDVIPLWKAEKWEPDHLMGLYKKAGAKYFCSIAMHHDNFDCWDSKFQHWNSVNMGPRRDVAGEWQKAAHKHGLRYGMTEHLAPSWWFYSVNKGSDKSGPMAGVPYDGTDPAFADLYWSGNEKPSFQYYGADVPLAYKLNWFNRIKDMVDRYHPDLLYSDSPLPYPEEAGQRLLAHYYNDNIRQHGGRLEAVYNCKQDPEGCWVQDLERGVMDGIKPRAWQTDTCVGNWYYKTDIKYKSSRVAIQMLCDIVSKNGNLLLNFPPRPDGTLDEQELAILADLAGWMEVNSEGIHATRPWKIYGEGPSTQVAIKSGAFNEDKRGDFTAQDVRFTTKGSTLYAFVMGWPEKEALVRALKENGPQNPGKIHHVKLLGYGGAVKWKQDESGLRVEIPSDIGKFSDIGVTLKVELA
jgi:alpha-L-fucosidase